MILFPNAKINLGLNVTEKRTDGFHNLETVFYPFNCCDVLEIIETKKGNSKLEFTFSGINVGGKAENNLVAKAYNLLDKEFDLPSVKIHLHKNIPMGAGLGGGSSDAAYALKGLNDLFQLQLSTLQLEDFAKKLGSDCAFFIRNKAVFASGKGDEFEELNFQLPDLKISIVHPGLHSNTADAYSGIQPRTPEISIKEVLKKNISEWKNILRNDFEETIFRKYPEVKITKQRFYDEGALYATMSGSGSAVFGIFENEVPEIKWPENFSVLRPI